MARAGGWIIGFGLLFGGTTATSASEFCIGSVDSLNAAIASAIVSGGTTTIKLQQGTYALHGSILFYDYSGRVYNALQLLGGYNADCSQRSLDPANTVLDDANQDGELYFLNLPMAGDIEIEGVTFRNLPGGLYVRPSVDYYDYVRYTIQNNIFDRTYLIAGDNYSNPAAGSTVRNNLFVGDALRYGSALTVAEVAATGNTVVGSASNGIFACGFGVGADSAVSDNILWGNAGYDLFIASDCRSPHGGEKLLLNNLYSTISGDAYTGSAGNIVGGDPKFVNAAAGDYRLQSTSPAINAGTTSIAVSGVDLDGHPRVVGSTVDMGAYESTIDDTIPQTIVVTSADAEGPGTLNQAIADANANPDFTYIEFNIPGTCPITIYPLQFGTTYFSLPTLTTSAKIDGFSQPGSVQNTAVVGDNAVRCIIIDGEGSVDTGIGFGGNSTTHVWVQGLAFEGFTGAALSLGGGNGDIVLGNQFGGKVGNVTLTANAIDIKLAQSARNALIGLDAPAFRNVIGGATDYGISIGAVGSSSTGHTISGNLFGIYGSGLFLGEASNTVAIRATTGDNTISANLLGNNNEAIELAGTNAANNAIESNGIGEIPPSCIVINHVQQCFGGSMPNQQGIAVSGGAHDNTIESNTIWNNPFGGIQINDAGQHNTLLANSLDANGGSAIALGGTTDGDNDAGGGAANLPNRGLNSPIVLRAYGGTRAGVLDGTLDSINDTYLIQIYASAPPTDGSGYNRYGERFLGSGTATIVHAPVGANGHTSFHLPYSSPAQSLFGAQITLLATDSLGNTSQFSAAVTYLCDVIFRNSFDNGQSDGCPEP
jgi:parallel beta-helix repeat protein